MHRDLVLHEIAYDERSLMILVGKERLLQKCRDRRLYCIQLQSRLPIVPRGSLNIAKRDSHESNQEMSD